MALDTKERILDVAERLFADFGYKATSLRDITSEARVNLASVNYHFGSKDALLAALLERRFAPVNLRRTRQLDTLEASAGSGGADLDGIVRAFLAPPFEMRSEWGEGGQKFLRLVGRIHSETDDIRTAFTRLFQPVMARFIAAFQEALPQVDPDEVVWRTHFMLGSMAHTMMWGESFASQDDDRCTPPEMLESLIQFAVAGMATPSKRGVAVPAGVSEARR